VIQNLWVILLAVLAGLNGIEAFVWDMKDEYLRATEAQGQMNTFLILLMGGMMLTDKEKN
jgi:succinate dehydrogenase/fumarate reductase cytochrome b subunit